MKIIEDKKNELLNRREVKIIVEAGKNPSIQEASKAIAEHFKTEEDKVAVQLVRGKFGRKTFLISANVYKSADDKNSIEPKKKSGKNQAEKAAEKPAEETKAKEEGK